MKLLKILCLLIYGFLVYFSYSLTMGKEIIEKLIIHLCFLPPIVLLVYWLNVLDIIIETREIIDTINSEESCQ
jgi:hypothetical protein